MAEGLRQGLLAAGGVLLGAALLAAVLLTVEAFRLRRDDPLAQPAFAALLAEVAAHPGDQALRQRVRTTDAAIRSVYDQRRLRLQHGAWLAAVLGGAGLVCLHLGRRGRPEVPDPRRLPAPQPQRAAAGLALGSLAGGALLAGMAAVLAWDAPTAPVPPPAAPAAPPPDAAAWAANWGCFRGPRGDGSAAGPFVASWDLAAGTNVRWQAPVPLPGTSSPVVWGGAVYLTGADAQDQAVLAFDAATGALRWRTAIAWPPGARPEAFADTGLAAPTPVSDGRAVAAIFASGALAACDPDGRLLWIRQLGVPESMYGYAASLALWNGTLIVQWDVNGEGRSALIGLDLMTGRERWRTPRPVENGWASPTCVRLGGAEVVLACGNPWFAAYDPASGRELWRCGLLNGDVAPSPLAFGDLALCSNTRCQLAAVRAGGSGELPAAGVVWKYEEDLPDLVSLAGDGRLVVQVSDAGTMTALRAADGQVAWKHEFGTGFTASPVTGGGRLLAVDNEGVAHVIALGDEFHEEAAIPCGEPVRATPAAVGGDLYLRTEKRLLRLGAKP